MQADRFFSSVIGFPLRARRRWAILLVAAALTPCWAPAAAAGTSPAGNAAKEKEEIPAPEDMLLPTADGVQLAVTYYAGGKGKKTIPVVLLHMWKQNRNDYKDLASVLQAMGFAVICAGPPRTRRKHAAQGCE